MLFSCHTSSAQRDAQTDAYRFQKLDKAIRSFSAEIEGEIDDLRARYDAVAASAAFAQQAVETEGRADLSPKVQELTAMLIRCSDRLAGLNRQRRFVAMLGDTIAIFNSGDPQAVEAFDGRRVTYPPPRAARSA